jgi:hypothetical protein
MDLSHLEHEGLSKDFRHVLTVAETSLTEEEPSLLQAMAG